LPYTIVISPESSSALADTHHSRASTNKHQTAQ